jgi:hypothetical protein
MTTITITSANVGQTLAQNGVLSALRFKVPTRAFARNFCLVDDAPPNDASPRQLFSSDMLAQPPNNNGALQSPYGNCFQDASIAFGNLTVQACPEGAVFEVDATGALRSAVTVVPSYPHEHLKLEMQRRINAEIACVAEARARRNAVPPTSVELTPHALPPSPLAPPDPSIINANKLADEQIVAERAARVAKRETIVGNSHDQIASEALIAARRRAQAGAV